jgi:uncharacterized protein (TIGR03067 family)
MRRRFRFFFGATAMRALPILLGLVLALAVGHKAIAEDKEAVKADLAKFQGEWSMVTGVADGQSMPDNLVATAKRVCKEDETTVTVGGQLILKAKFKLDPSQKPKTIDYEAIDGPTKGRKHLGIYEVSDDGLKFCFAAPDGERPTTFESKAGDLRTFSVWKRAKAEPK